MKNKKTAVLALVIVLFTMNSCIGLSADILVSGDGSGRITLEYRVSQVAEALGRLEGNERWQIIPTGRADIERTVARIPDMRLVSFATREDSRDTINTVVLEFGNIDALLFFLDSSGGRAFLSRENGGNRLSIAVMDGSHGVMDAALLDLVRQISQGYEFNLSFSAAGGSALALSDGGGNALEAPPGARLVAAGARVSFAMATADILEQRQGLTVNLTW
ncbi:MAG: hypothetical protein FWG66_14755 [Spirochaetes bacterium]|nr:hypothetical protein [Spirochaetota bacterium]